jgi:hypothetical protein
MKYIVQYTLPYDHIVRVGIEADTPDKAIAKASKLFDEGSIWDDTEDSPLLLDDFYENSDAGVPLEFTIESEVTGTWQDPDGSVITIRQNANALKACRLLVMAYEKYCNQDSVVKNNITISELFDAYKYASAAVNRRNCNG